MASSLLTTSSMEGLHMMVRRQLMAVILMCIARSAAAAPHDIPRTVSARIYDYAHFNSQQLQRAQRQVSETYAAAGVTLEWHRTVSPDLIDAGKGRWPSDGVTTLSVVVLAAKMATRLGVLPDVAGYAPITRDAGGRIAYVLGGRVRGIAIDGKVESWVVLAGVIIHEVAHLLMPEREHTSAGVMRANWNPAEFKRVPVQRFSEAEALSLRRTVSSLEGHVARVAD
ncbi:MAG: hypothetical protein ABL961_17030 [Vicinamibacterales bacterium]